jgi:bifunctional non-homologous end joining protein LigD
MAAGISSMKIPIRVESLIRKGRKEPRPRVVRPMLCTIIREPFNDKNWVYEVKWDGYRIVASIERGRVRLTTRNNQDYTHKYAEVAKALSRIDVSIVLDGEVVVIDEEGKPDFGALQRYNPSMALTYFVFDILWIGGYSLVNLPLSERREILEAVLPADMIFRLSEQFPNGVKLFERMKNVGMEGIIAKRKDSIYTMGRKGDTWYKLQTEFQGEYVIGGYTESDSSRPFASLLFGNYQNGKLVYVGNAGGGYKESEMKDILDKLKRYEVSESPFSNEAQTDRKTHWLEPALVANFKFATFTDSGIVRKPAIFLGFRDDKRPDQVVPELPKSVRATRKHSVKKNAPVLKPAASRKQKKEGIVEGKSNWAFIDQEKISSRAEFVIDDKKFELTNVEKELWNGVRKADLIDYYHSIAPWILPYLKDRPLSLHVKMKAARAQGFYIKDMEGRQPRWAELFSIGRKHKVKGKRAVIDYLVCQDEPSLLYTVNLGCIDMNPWTARTTNPFSPDFVVIDLDPSDGDFGKAIEAAKATKLVLDKHKIKGFLKTSGKTGVHIYLPVEGFTFPEARAAATVLCREVHELLPETTTTEISVGKRGTKLYLDPNQNDQADTVAAPYSVRPHNKPTVSTPLEWRELTAKLDPAQFDIKSIFPRLKRKGDLFAAAISGKYDKQNGKRLKALLRE